jgi:toxin CcdB
VARFDLYRMRRGREGYLLDVQSGLLDFLATRVVVPLLPPEQAGKVVRDLTPVFEIEGRPFIMATPLLTAVPQRELGRPVGSLDAHWDRLTRAIDILFTGV